MDLRKCANYLWGWITSTSNMLTLLRLLQESKLTRVNTVNKYYKVPNIFNLHNDIYVYPFVKFLDGMGYFDPKNAKRIRFKYLIGLKHIPGRIHYNEKDYDSYDFIIGFDAKSKLEYKPIIEKLPESIDSNPVKCYEELKVLLESFGKTPLILRCSDIFVKEKIDDTFTIKQSSKG